MDLSCVISRACNEVAYARDDNKVKVVEKCIVLDSKGEGMSYWGCRESEECRVVYIFLSMRLLTKHQDVSPKMLMHRVYLELASSQ
jgi:hypothetical protein